MSYINPAPGASGVKLYLTDNAGTLTGNLAVPALQDMTINNANDVFTWSQLDSASKLQVATTATNSISTNIVVDELSFFGNASAGTVYNEGIFGMSKNKTKVNFTVVFGEGRSITGSGYVTGLAPAITADAPVWVTPLTLTVSGDYTVAGS